MAKKKFISPAIFSVEGFVSPLDPEVDGKGNDTRGERIHGKLKEFKPPIGKQSAGFFIVELLSPCKMVLSQDDEMVTVPKGKTVGLNKYTCFSGLETDEYMGSIIDAKFVGRKDLGKGREPAYQFEIEIDDGK